ncbi:hypothetical protein BKA70DRAFT_1256765 [Coprinopsis sp. MPI-PUGE-AT-0042]|nr:hypothetical protein BKA70DRAFT_1256765 [Coprinopsis sp. MPI-PUGE-AT-0042]
MSADQYHVEQDRAAPGDEGELPTYDDLAAQNGPNSRFGRWRGWIEKRAAERYAEITPEERQRRRERGWDLPERQNPNAPPGALPETQIPLHIQTSNLSIHSPPETSNQDDASVHLPFVSQSVAPTHLKLNQFGSRFLPHATSQIHCVLPLMADRLILIGHDEGLSVLDMFPQEWTENGGIAVKQPSEAQSHLIWRGETIYQMTILELEETGEGTQQGVVLALVGPEPDSPSLAHKDSDFRALRMYNLGSLTSLARWAVAQKGARPLDLHRPSHWQAQQPSPPRKHRAQGSIARSIRSFISDSPAPCPQPESSTSYHSMVSSPAGHKPPPIVHHPRPAPTQYEHPVPVRHQSDDSTWDVVEDLPLRWATDFVPLASPGSRLAGTSVIAYATWNDKNRRSTGGQYLAIATKNSILLYESPKGERAFRFMKDFYTPIQPKNVMFYDQLVQQEMYAGPSPNSPGKHHRAGSTGSIRPQPVLNDQNDGTTINYGTQLALFVVFEKKASWIRVADSAVGEFELREDGGPSGSGSTQLNVRDSLASPSGSVRLRSRLSMVGERESASRWILPAKCELPVPLEVKQFASDIGLATKTVYLLTRGKRSHLLPCPLPSKSSSVPPLHVIYWRNPPRHVAVRICHPSRGGITVAPRFSQQKPTLFQAVAFGEQGMEVYETTVLSLFLASGPSKGKGRSVASPYDSIRADEDLGGETGYLSYGGNWDRADELYGGAPGLERQNSASSYSSLGSDAVAGVLRDEIGMYGWCRKGSGDYRIFWVGGSYGDGDEETEDDDIY